MKHIWSVICQSSSIDFEKNLVSLFNCLEEISVVIDKSKAPDNKKIFIPTEFQLVSFWTVEDTSKENSIEMKGELVSPEGEILNSFNNNFKVKSGIPRFRNRTNISGLPVTVEGRYFLKVWQKVNDGDMEQVAEVPLDVRVNYKIM